MIPLAQRPTPLHRLHRLSAAVGAEIYVKRDDLTGFGLSGNKVRKLERLVAEAEAQGADTLLTTGGVQSNHCRATAVAARQRGLRPHFPQVHIPGQAVPGKRSLERGIHRERRPPEAERNCTDVRRRR